MSYRAAVTAVVGLVSLAPACATDVCGQRCGVAGECPSGFVCESAGYCVPESDREACGVAGLEAGGSPSGDDAARLAIEVRAPSDSCASDEVQIELAASGGNGASYRWRVFDASGSFAPLEASGSRWVLSGAPAAAGNIELRVELSDGTTSVEQPIALVVHARPRLVTERVPALCPGERVSLKLAAEGGDPGSYEFSAELAADLGLRVEGASLTGRFSPPSSSAARLVAPAAVAADDPVSGDVGPAGVAPRIVLSVRDRHCASSPREISLDVLPAGSEACPQILVSAANATLDRLPPPCLGSDYEQHFVTLPADPAAGPIDWRAIATAPGLEFDPSERVLRGTPLGDGAITLQATAEGGRIIEAEFPVAPRRHCWLAYLARPDGAQRLHLFDPRLPEQASARRAYPAAADPGAGGGVLDFAFSPRGRFLAYRLAPDGGDVQLRLLDLWTWRERALEFAGSIEAYAWSGLAGPGDGSSADALAVAFDAAGQVQLGGLLLSPALATTDAVSTPFAPYDIAHFQPAPAPVLSALTWFDVQHVGFLAPDPLFAEGRLFQWAHFGDGVVSLEPPRTRLEFFEASRFQPAPGGIFVSDSSTGQPHFFASNGLEVDHRVGMLISPSGAFTARAAGGVLQVFRAGDRSVLDTDPAWVEAPGCTSILAWARGRERIACADAAGGNQRLTFFDLPEPERPELVPLDRVRGDYRFLSGQHVGQPRVFADGGGRFAFSTGDEVYVVQLDDGAPRIEASAPLTLAAGGAPQPVQLSFSARARFLATHAADSLSLWSLDSPGDDRFGRLPVLLPEPSTCSENPLEAVPWCGAASGDAVARWSTEEDALVFQTSDGSLQVEDLSLGFPTLARVIAVDASCGEGCVVAGSYVFQP